MNTNHKKPLQNIIYFKLKDDGDSISFGNLYQDKTQKATFDLLNKVND